MSARMDILILSESAAERRRMQFVLVALELEEVAIVWLKEIEWVPSGADMAHTNDRLNWIPPQIQMILDFNWFKINDFHSKILLK